MNESQRHGIAAGFLHVLETHPDVYERWARTPKNVTAVGKLIQEVMGLANVPDQADLRAMEVYIEAHLTDQVGKIHKANSKEPVVGSIGMGAEQD